MALSCCKRVSALLKGITLNHVGGLLFTALHHEDVKRNTLSNQILFLIQQK